MNAKQFVNTVLLEGVDRLQSRFKPIADSTKALIDFLFPRFLRPPIPRFWRNGLTVRGVLFAYLFIFLLLFVAQALWAAANRAFLPDTAPNSRTFLEDTENLINYAFLCEAYCITGLAFLVQTSNIRTSLRRDGTPIPPLEQTGYLRRGYLGGLAVFFLALLGSAGYAVEIHRYSFRYWFMSSGPPDISLGGAGYYYLFINFLLLLFVVWVGFAHFGLYHVARSISSYLRELADPSSADLAREWCEDDTARTRLASFARYVVTSKLMVLWLMLNMLTWKTNEPNADIMYGLSVVVIAGFGIWVFSLPRYSVQRHLFRLRQLYGMSAYPDIRGPWILGLSSVLDFILFSFVVNYLLGDALGKLLENAFS